MADFATLAAVKAALDITDASADILLAGLNSVATDLILDVLNRDPRATDYVERANGIGGAILLLNEYPINSISSITIAPSPSGYGPPPDPFVLDPAGFDFDSDSVWRTDGQSWPRGRRNVTVVYNAGLDPAPKGLSLAAIYTVRALLTARKVDLNASGESWAGVSSAAWSANGPGTVPLAALSLLNNHMRRSSV